MSWSPMMIEQLLHYYYSAEPYPESMAAKSNVKELITEGLIEPYSGSNSHLYRVTERGTAHVKTLLELPLPIQIWITPKEAGHGRDKVS